ncbi:MAG: DUF421 domain-containing protein [Bacillota bacterium]
MKEFLEIIIQTIFAFSAIFIFSRIIGKKQISELSFHDYVNGITFGSIAATMATDLSQHTWQYFAALFLFALMNFILQYVSMKSRWGQKIIEGEPVVIIHEGKILEDNLKKTRFNLDNLSTELRKQGIFDIKNVHYAILETDGALSILPNASKKALTPEDLNLQGQEEAIMTELIREGQIIKPNLKQHGLTEEWVYDKLREHNIENIEEVIAAKYNPLDESLYIDLKDDRLGKDTVDISEME